MSRSANSCHRHWARWCRAAALLTLISAGLASIVASGGGCGELNCPQTDPPPGPGAEMSVFPQRYTFGGEALAVEVVLRDRVPAGSTATFTVTSTLPAGNVGLPSGLSIPAGGNRLNFDVTTSAVNGFIDGRVDVTWTNRVENNAVAPITSGQPTTLMPEPTSLQLSFTPNAVPGGQSSTLQIGITPVYPISMIIEMSADSPLVQVPPQVSVNGNAISRSEPVGTSTTATAQAVNITARLRGVVDIETLLVNTTASGQLPLSVAVSGGGHVTSNPPGIDCGGVCTALFNIGSTVTLTPVADAGQRFFGWGGDGDCNGGAVTLSVQRACTAIFTAQLVSPPGGNGWVQLGATLATSSDVDPTPSLAMDGANPVVAHVEAVGGDAARLHVRRLEGNNWVALGGGALNAGSITAASEPSLRLTANGLPYLAWSQGNGLQQNVFVARFNGTDWESVGAAGVPLNFTAGSDARSPSLAFGAAGHPMVAWIENGAVRFKWFDGRAWVVASGGAGPASGVADRVRLSSYPNGVPVLVWTEGSGANRAIRAARDFALTPLGTQINAAAAAGRTAINHFDVLAEASGAFVTWGQGVAPFDILTRRWNGGAWIEFGNNRIINNNPNQLVSLAIDRRSLNVANSWFTLNADVSNLGVSNIATASGNWLALTPPFIDVRQEQAASLSLEMANNTSPVIAGSHRNAQNLYQLRVRRYFPATP